MVKKTIVAIMAIIALLQSPAWSQPIKVTVYGEDEYPPYSYREGRDIKGIYPDILREAFSRMDRYDVDLDTMPWKRMIGELKAGRIFALFAPYWVETRPWMIYSKPILEEKVVVFGLRSKMQGRSRWPEDFYGARVGLTHGYAHEVLLGERGVAALKEGKIKLKNTMDNRTNLMYLLSGKIDLYLNDSLTDMKGQDEAEDPVVIAAEVGTQWGYLGLSSNLDRFPFVQDFKASFNSTIESLKKEGFIDRVIETYRGKKPRSRD